MFTVGVVMPGYLASKALICREIFCEFVPLCLSNMTAGACNQHMTGDWKSYGITKNNENAAVFLRNIEIIVELCYNKEQIINNL